MKNTVDLERFIEECLINERVCPIPTKWNDLFSLIQRRSDASNLSVPLVLGAWWATTNSDKKRRFKDQIEFAYQNGLVNEVKSFLLNLEENQWHHLKD